MMEKRFVCQKGSFKLAGTMFAQDQTWRPALILCHGFLADQSMCKTYARLAASLGYAAFTFDFGGGGIRSKSNKQEMTLLTERDDILAVTDYVCSLDWIDKKRISLMGCSQGGFAAALAAKVWPYRSLILFYPALCIPDDARKGKMMFYSFDPQNIPDVLGHFPMKLYGSYAKTVLDMDAFKAIQGYAGPVLYVQGDKDAIVDVSYARKGKDCFPHVSYWEIPEGGHMFRGKAEKKAQEILKDFLVKQR